MRWTRKAIVEEIRRLFAAGEELNYSAVEEKHLNLVRAAAWHYGTWKRAVEKAGLDYDDISKYQRWSQERVVERILELHKQGKDLSWRAVSMEVDPPLAAAALRPNSGFATWYDAITRAGLNHDEIARYRRWTSERVLEELRGRAQRGEPMSSIMVQRQNPSLYCAAKRRFLQWDSALVAAGLDPDKIRIRRAPTEASPFRRRRSGSADQAVDELVDQARVPAKRGRKRHPEMPTPAPKETAATTASGRRRGRPKAAEVTAPPAPKATTSAATTPKVASKSVAVKTPAVKTPAVKTRAVKTVAKTPVAKTASKSAATKVVAPMAPAPAKVKPQPKPATKVGSKKAAPTPEPAKTVVPVVETKARKKPAPTPVIPPVAPAAPVPAAKPVSAKKAKKSAAEPQLPLDLPPASGGKKKAAAAAKAGGKKSAAGKSGPGKTDSKKKKK